MSRDDDKHSEAVALARKVCNGHVFSNAAEVYDATKRLALALLVERDQAARSARAQPGDRTCQVPYACWWPECGCPLSSTRLNLNTTQEQRDEWRKERGHGMTSAVGEYTPSAFWDLLDDVDDLVAARSAIEETEDSVGDWQCKDFGDGWITFPNRKAAEAHQAQTGALMRYRRLYPAAHG